MITAIDFDDFCEQIAKYFRNYSYAKSIYIYNEDTTLPPLDVHKHTQLSSLKIYYNDNYKILPETLYDNSDKVVTNSVKDIQIGGNHYDLPIQPIEYIFKNNLSYFQGNVVKYITRYKNKNGLEDLKKAKHYIDMIIEQEYSDEVHK